MVDEGCAGVVIVHSDGSTTCSEASCVPPGGAALSAGHRWFAPCRAVFVEESCPRCAPGGGPGAG